MFVEYHRSRLLRQAIKPVQAPYEAGFSANALAPKQDRRGRSKGSQDPPEFTFHSMRHTFGTALFKRGEPPKIEQSLLGHASIVQTMDTYSHLLEDIGGDAVGGLDEAFG